MRAGGYASRACFRGLFGGMGTAEAAMSIRDVGDDEQVESGRAKIAVLDGNSPYVWKRSSSEHIGKTQDLQPVDARESRAQ